MDKEVLAYEIRRMSDRHVEQQKEIINLLKEMIELLKNLDDKI